MADTSSLREAISEAVLSIHETAMRSTLAETLDAAPVKTGLLVANTDVSTSALVGDLVAFGSIFSLVPYAGYTDAGTPPHVIPGNPWLAFFWERENTWVISRTRDGHEPMYVNHPGTTGTQWFNSGTDDGEPMASRWDQACLDAAAA